MLLIFIILFSIEQEIHSNKNLTLLIIFLTKVVLKGLGSFPPQLNNIITKLTIEVGVAKLQA